MNGRRARGIHWAEGSTVVQGIGQGYTQANAARAGDHDRACRDRHGGRPAYHAPRRGRAAERAAIRSDWPVLDIDDRHLAIVRQGLFEVVNTPRGHGL